MVKSITFRQKIIMYVLNKFIKKKKIWRMKKWTFFLMMHL